METLAVGATVEATEWSHGRFLGSKATVTTVTGRMPWPHLVWPSYHCMRFYAMHKGVLGTDAPNLKQRGPHRKGCN
jgi:hypothetical protein